jgi:hypothetical protein
MEAAVAAEEEAEERLAPLQGALAEEAGPSYKLCKLSLIWRTPLTWLSIRAEPEERRELREPMAVTEAMVDRVT